jgi:hypothetical protein
VDRFLLKLVDPQPCMGSNPDDDGSCPLLTQLSEAEHESGCERQLRVMPYCWQHLWIGYPERDEGPTAAEKALEAFCIVNFVVNHFGGVGFAEVLGPCPIDNIPAPYEADEDEEDKAWYVTYRDEGQEQRGVAVYLTSWENWWEWYPANSS